MKKAAIGLSEFVLKPSNLINNDVDDKASF